MRYEFSIENIDCANCASKVETALRKDEKFKHVTINFMLKKLEVETEETQDVNTLMHYIQKQARKYEDGVDIREYHSGGKVNSKACNCDHDHHNHDHSHDHAHHHGHDHDHNHEHHHDHEHNHNHHQAKRNYSFKRIDKELLKIIVGLTLFGAGMVVGEPILYIVAYILVGYEVVFKAVRNIVKGKVFDENFLMVIATVAAFAIKDYPEAVAVMIFYQVGEYLQHRAVGYSRKAISELIDIRPEFARIVDHGTKEVEPNLVKVGDVIEVRPGEKIPLDGVLVEGNTTLDTSALTGESLPVFVSAGMAVLSGSINKERVIRIEVTKTFSESTVSKILRLIESASSKKSVAENFITKFAAWYTPIVVVLAVAIAIIPSMITGNWHDWVYTSVVFLVISCPCALVVSIPLGFFGGIGAASRKGILLKGSNYLEILTDIDTIVLDKTGTITKGEFGVQDIIVNDGITKEALLRYAAIAESSSNHPIAKSIVAAYGKGITENIVDYKEIAGLGVRVIMGDNEILAGNSKLMEEYNVIYQQVSQIGTYVYIAVDGKYQGCIIVADQIKEDSKEAISNLRKNGIKKIVMLTGDKQDIANHVGRKVGVDEVYSELLPQDKVERLEQILANGNKVAFVGDGINDAPVLARADLGIAMGGIGSDAAVEASDMVIMTDELSLIDEARKIAKKTRRIVTQNIVFALGIKLIIMLLGVVGITTMWLAVFADVGVSLLAILNALRVLKD